MHFTTLLPTILTLSLTLPTTILAIPTYNPETNEETDATLLNALNLAPAPLTDIHPPAPKAASNATCPSFKPAKQCCQSIDGVTDDVMREVGSVVPWVSGVAVSSILALDCTGMADDASTDECLQQIMCCEGEPGATSTLETFKSQCQPYDEALADQEKDQQKAKMQAMQSAAAVSASASAVATPVSSGRVGM
ncbi:hypothetical protein BO71DRAFT_185432 [Aspergillus ellipticus CBS 707.79]|uniref:Hydrophobin n=1 Tax=Aspergillus ellipticus CBS 707.79 TaxID=1448320 RepID=A0A319DFI6_9EURO|nr:hypothetical protein BO71DRAFT_185432 [Aspergillus ellipticus CBS 707.79]